MKTTIIFFSLLCMCMCAQKFIFSHSFLTFVHNKTFGFVSHQNIQYTINSFDLKHSFFFFYLGLFCHVNEKQIEKTCGVSNKNTLTLNVKFKNHTYNTHTLYPRNINLYIYIYTQSYTSYLMYRFDTHWDKHNSIYIRLITDMYAFTHSLIHKHDTFSANKMYTYALNICICIHFFFFFNGGF